MISIPLFALVHQARVVRVTRAGAKDEQGERVPVEQIGTWFPARRMTPRPGKDPGEPGGHRRVEGRFQLLWGDEYEDGSELLDPPQPGDYVDVDDGRAVTRYVVGTPQDLDTGTQLLGGEADITVVADAS